MTSEVLPPAEARSCEFLSASAETLGSVVSPQRYAQVLTPTPQSTTLFGNRVVTDVIISYDELILE